MTHRKENQSGQAIMELMVMLIAFMICFIGLLTIMGLSIANIEILNEAKFNADRNAEYSEHSSDGREISGWKYTTFDLDQGTEIPFLPHDRPGMLLQNMASFNYELNNPAYSVANADYIFNNFNRVSTVRGNFGVDTPNAAYIAANLHKGQAGNFNSGENIVLISDKRYFDRSKTYTAIEKLLGISLKKLDLENNHSNTAYTPAMKIK